LPSALRDQLERFSDRWVYTDNSPITYEEWMQYRVASFRHTHDTAIVSKADFITTITGYTQTRRYSYPNTVERLKYCVDFAHDASGDEILGAYVFLHPKAIHDLREYLHSMSDSIKNQDDLADVLRELANYELLANHIRRTAPKRQDP